MRAQRLALLTIATGLLYLGWLLTAVSWDHPVLAGAFILAEIFVLMIFAMAAAGSWRLRFKPVEAVLEPLPEPVDVFITVSDEPAHVVARTIDMAMRITWRARLTVFVLDDGGSPEIEELARSLGATYRSRRREQLSTADGKAGNLNVGLSLSTGTYVLVLDADQTPVPEIVERLAPYLSLPSVAFVQSKQSFSAGGEDRFNADQPAFYNTMQQAFDAQDTVLSCGSGVLYRRAALDSIGGFITWNVLEDLTTSYELHNRGWKSLYYPYPLSRGVAPDTLGAVCRQRALWAFDTLRLMFWRCPLLRPTLSWPKRLNYSVIGFSYLAAALIAPLLFALPVWSYATGDSILPGHELAFGWWRSAYFVSMALALRWMFRGHQPGRQFQMLVGLFPVYLVSACLALGYRSHTPGQKSHTTAAVVLRMPTAFILLPQLLLLAGNILGPVCALVAGTAPAALVAMNLPVSAMAIWSLSHVCRLAFNLDLLSPDRHPVRFYASAVES